MADRENVIKRLRKVSYYFKSLLAVGWQGDADIYREHMESVNMAIAMLKEQEKKRITLHKKHVITWSRNDKFSMRELYEAVCETLLDEGELFITRTDNHEKVDFVFYIAEGGEAK